MGLKLSKERVVKFMNDQKPPMEIQIISFIGRTLLVLLLGLGVNYLKDIGQETVQLNIGIVEMKTELHELSQHQNEINNDIRKQIDKLIERLEYVERKTR